MSGEGPPAKRVRFDPTHEEILLDAESEDKDAQAPDQDKDKKHTLESDEEEEEEAHMNADKIDGQEDASIEYDGDIKIMPFNMKDDLEEGYLDKDGAFVYKKEKEDIRDEWLDSVNWDGVKQKAGKNWQQMDEEDAADEGPKIDGIAACEKVISYLKTDEETVSQILKKINSDKNLTAAQERKLRWEAKRKGVAFSNPKSEEAQMLTGAVDDLISMGHMDAYSMKREDVMKILEELEIAKERAERAKRTQEQNAKENEEKKKAELLAAFADDNSEEEAMDEEPVPEMQSIDGIVSEVHPNT